MFNIRKILTRVAKNFQEIKATNRVDLAVTSAEYRMAEDLDEEIDYAGTILTRR